MPRLLCITAHPDDEAGGFGGTLALYAERGVEISVVCLTAGTAARNRGDAKTDAELAEMRTRELGDSCRLLGIKQWEVLGYQDGHLAEAPLPEVVGDLVKRVVPFDYPLTLESMSMATQACPYDSDDACRALDVKWRPVDETLADAIRDLSATGRLNARLAGSLAGPG